MAARKLQSEIDRTLKKISEGVELFETIYDKMQASTNQTQKEKQELDLKTQIKKLQRLRDQIKTWVASSEIKDKTILLENRKLIETQMEKFKACEKEMKTKAFSKEGLTQATKLDPREQEKEEATLWLQSQVEELQIQVEQAEAEIEALQGSGKKRNKSGSSSAGRQEGLEALNERRKWHISRLEIILRLLNNGSLSTERVLNLKEDVQYFVESNTEDEFEEDEGIYDDLNLEEEEEKFGLAMDDDESDGSDGQSEDVLPRTPAKKHDEESITSSKREESPILKKASASIQMRKTSIASELKPPPNLSFAQQPMSSVLKAGLAPQPPRSTTLPPIRYSAAAAAAVSIQTNQQTIASPTHAAPVPAAASSPVANPAVPLLPVPQPPPTSQETTSSPSLTHPSVTSPILSSASISHPPDGSFYSGQGSPAISEAEPNGLTTFASPLQTPPKEPTASSPVLTGDPTVQALTAPESPDPPIQSSLPQTNGTSVQTQTVPSVSQHTAPAVSPLPQQVQQYTMPAPNNLTATTQPPPQAPQFPPGVKATQGTEAEAGIQQNQQSGGTQRPPSASAMPQPLARREIGSTAALGSLSDLVASFENAKQRAAMRMTNLDQVHKYLEGAHTNIPQPQDTEKPKYYVPQNPFQTPPYYPQTPSPVLSNSGIYSQLDVETLFFVFYYQPGTYQQHLAAKELKRQSWRFHIKYLTWFQRHSEPQAITEEYEQGVYVYFDWEGSWCQRKKSDFRFEYRYLSED